MSQLLIEQLNTVDTIVLGRITYLKMADYWRKALHGMHIPREDYPLANLMNRRRKIVFSSSSGLPEWENTIVISTVAEKELKKLKEEKGKDMIVLGSGLLIQSLIVAGMIDELILWIHPVALNKGRLLFTTMSGNFLLSLKRTEHTDSGVTVMFYEILQCQSPPDKSVSFGLTSLDRLSH